MNADESERESFVLKCLLVVAETGVSYEFEDLFIQPMCLMHKILLHFFSIFPWLEAHLVMAYFNGMSTLTALGFPRSSKLPCVYKLSALGK